MNDDFCKNCKYCKVYFIGTSADPKFICRCFWALKKAEDVKPTECNKETR